MARQTSAPWAEIVPNRGPKTADERLHMPDDGWHYELADGVLVKMPPPGFEHGRIVTDLAVELAGHAKSRQIGQMVTGETGFWLSRPGQADTVLAPDSAFVRAENVPPRGTPGTEKYLRVAPDLVVEVASPDQYKSEMAAKVKIFLDAGGRLVWVVWPGTKTVDVWRQGGAEPVATRAVGDNLDGADMVPDFTYPLADLFA